MNARIATFLAAALSLAALLPHAHADGMAFVNMEKVFSEYFKYFRANDAFELKKKDFMERVDILREELESMVREARKLEADVDNELLKEEAREESRRKLKLRAERIRAKENEFNQFRRGGMGQLQRQRMEMEEELIQEIAEFVKNYCKNQGFDLVFDSTGNSLNRMPVVLHFPPELEITDQVVAEINRGHEDEVAAAKAKAAAEEAEKDEEEEGDDDLNMDAPDAE